MKKISQYFGVVLLSLVFVGSVFVAGARAQSQNAKALIAEVKGGGYVIVLRHGATNHDQKDAWPPDFSDLTKQRRLSDEGRQVATQIGEAVKKLGISFDKVITSKLDRGIETGKLVSGTDGIQTLDLTESSDSVAPAEKERRAMALRAMVGVVPTPGKDTLLVTHKPNIVDAFGMVLQDIDEGEAAVFKPNGAGQGDLVGRLKAMDWMDMPMGKQPMEKQMQM